MRSVSGFENVLISEFVMGVICGTKHLSPIDWPIQKQRDDDDDLIKMFMKCTSVDATLRPVLEEVKKTVVSSYRHLFKGKSIVDHMMVMMERYAGELETLVQERTQALEEAQKRADRLLYQVGRYLSTESAMVPAHAPLDRECIEGGHGGAPGAVRVGQPLLRRHRRVHVLLLPEQPHADRAHFE